MILRTWSGSRLDTRKYRRPWRIACMVARGWIAYGFYRLIGRP